MDVSGEYTSRMALVGVQVAKQVQVTQALVVSQALDSAQQVASTPPAPAPSRPGGVDIKV